MRCWYQTIGSCEAQDDLLPTTFPKCGTLFTYGNALVMSTLRSPSTGRIFFLVVSVMVVTVYLCSWWGFCSQISFLTQRNTDGLVYLYIWPDARVDG